MSTTTRGFKARLSKASPSTGDTTRTCDSSRSVNSRFTRLLARTSSVTSECYSFKDRPSPSTQSHGNITSCHYLLRRSEANSNSAPKPLELEKRRLKKRKMESITEVCYSAMSILYPSIFFLLNQGTRLRDVCTHMASVAIQYMRHAFAEESSSCSWPTDPAFHCRLDISELATHHTL